MRKRGRGEICTYCRRIMEPVGSRGRLAATMDHVLPQSKGGKGPWVRKVWCCRQCNTLKGSMMPDAWSAFMAATPEWWKRDEYKVPRTKRHTHSMAEKFAYDTDITDAGIKRVKAEAGKILSKQEWVIIDGVKVAATR